MRNSYVFARSILVFIMIISGFPGAVYAQEEVGISSGWMSVLQSMNREVFESHQQLQNEYPDAQLPEELNVWMNEFTASPLANNGSVESLIVVGNALQSKYNSSMLPDDQRQMINSFLTLIGDVSQDLGASIAGQQAQSRPQRLAELEKLTRLHGSDQQWVDATGNELAALYKQMDLQGVLTKLKSAMRDLPTQP